MNSRWFLLAGALIAGLTQCHGRIDTPRTPSGNSACLPSTQPITNGVTFDLPDLVGSIRLSPGTVEQPLGKNPDGRKYILEDSTVLEVWVTPEPAAGMAVSGGAKAGDAGFCSTQLGKFAAMVSRAALAGPSGDSVFVGMINITVDQEHALNVAVTTATRASRDDVLTRVPGFLQLR
jgi:hypothetical protein